MAQQAPVKPTIPQNNPTGAAARQAYLATMQQQYEWTDTIAALPGVPAVKTLPESEQPTLEWWLMLVTVLVDIHANDTAADEALAAQGLAGLDPLVVDADKAFVASVEKLVTSLQQKLANTKVTKQDFGTVAAEFLEEQAAKVAVAALRDYAEKLIATIEHRAALRAATGASDPRSLESYREIFKTIDIPAIAYTFQDDREFARLRVAGPNAVLIELVEGAVPASCPITEEQYAAIVPNDTLSAALADGRIFQCDYKDLATIEPGEWNGNAKYLTCPVALFAVPPQSGSLVPIAINCDPSNPACQVITPSSDPDMQWGWEMAKFCVQAADGNYHELFAHLARTHLVIEAVAVATHRHLPDQHPLWALLVRHFEGTMFINWAAAVSLITKGGPIDHIFAGTIESSQATAAKARLSFNFSTGALPADLAARGFGPDSRLSDYPYRDDALLVWGAIEGWVSNYVSVYYADDSDVAGDTELAAWASAIAGAGSLEGFNAPTTIAELVQVCTMIIFTGSAQHAAVNFPQRAIMEFAPAVTGAMWQQAPDEQANATKADWLAMLPPQEMALEQLKVLYLLGSIYYRPLGTYLSPQFPYPQWFQDPDIIGDDGPLARFEAALAGVEQTITQRNDNRLHPYPFLMPSLIPSSTNI